MITKEKNVFLIAKENIIQELRHLGNKFIELQKNRAKKYLKKTENNNER